MNGCKLSGTTKPGAYIVITPTTGGIYKGTVYDNRRQVLKASSTGEWSVMVAPSIVAGLYKISIGRQVYLNVEIPDRVEAQLARLIV